MSAVAIAFALVGTAFVFLCGANDGAAMLALAVHHREVPPYVVLGVLLVAVAAGPALFGLAVARTFTDRLLDPGDRRGPVILLAGVAAAMLLIAALTWRGVPTSITLAVIGGLAGAAVGAGAHPVWSAFGRVLMVAAAAPVVGVALGLLFGMAARRLPTMSRLPAVLRLAHLTAFSGQSLAYAANDGQKMFAVAGVGLAVLHGSTGMRPPDWPILLALTAVFGAGALLSLRRIARGATFGLLPPRPWRLVSAELAAAVAVLGSAGVGAPVSMTQSMAAGLVGAGASQGMRRVRWQFAMPILVAWLVTLPASLIVGVAAGAMLRLVG